MTSSSASRIPSFESVLRSIRFEDEMTTARWCETQGLPTDDGLPARLTFVRWMVIGRRMSEHAGALTTSRALRSEDWSPS